MQNTLDVAGRRRSPATFPEYLAGRPPRNKGRRYPAWESPSAAVLGFIDWSSPCAPT
jgi:hypothetical protein